MVNLDHSYRSSFLLCCLLMTTAGLTVGCGDDGETTGPDDPPPPAVPEEIPSINPSNVEPVGDVLVVTDQVTVITESTMSPADLRDAIAEFGGSIMASLPGLDETDRRIYQVELATSSAQDVAEIANALTESPGVITALERTLVPTEDHLDNETLNEDQAWAYETVGASDAWHMVARSSTDLEPVKIGAIDTGVDSDHPELADRIALGQSFLAEDPAEWEDSDGHGTKVAGTIVAKADNGGMNGIIGPAGPQAELYVYRTGLIWDSRWDQFVGNIDQCETGSLDRLAILGALMKAQADQLDVVNMSFAPFYVDQLSGARARTVQFLTDLLSQNPRLVLVAAAGNHGQSADQNWPVGDQNERFILVGGTDPNDNRWRAGTSCNRKVESAVGPISIAAPSTNVWTTDLGGAYGFAHGTSLAAPLVTGAIGTLLTLSVPAVDVKDLLQSTATKIATDQGQWKRLELCRSVADALRLTDPSKTILAESGQDENQPPSYLYRVEPFECGRDQRIAEVRAPDGTSLFISDLAMDGENNLWGSSFESLYRIDRNTGTARKVGQFGVDGVNALDFSPDGTLYGAAHQTGLFGSPEPGVFLHIDTATADALVVGSLDSDLGPTGDLEFSNDGTLFASVRDIFSGENALATIDTTTGRAELVDSANSLEFTGVFGLTFVDTTLFGLTADGDGAGKLIVIDAEEGTGREIRPLDFDAFGAASRRSSENTRH